MQVRKQGLFVWSGANLPYKNRHLYFLVPTLPRTRVDHLLEVMIDFVPGYGKAISTMGVPVSYLTPGPDPAITIHPHALYFSKPKPNQTKPTKKGHTAHTITTTTTTTTTITPLSLSPIKRYNPTQPKPTNPTTHLPRQPPRRLLPLLWPLPHQLRQAKVFPRRLMLLLLRLRDAEGRVLVRDHCAAAAALACIEVNRVWGGGGR